MIFLSERFSFRSSSTDLLDAHEIKKFDMKSRKKKYAVFIIIPLYAHSLSAIGTESIEFSNGNCALLPVTVELFSVL